MKKTNKIVLSILSFIVLSALMIVFVLYPLYKEIKENSKELIFQKKQLSILETKINNLEKFKTLYKSLEDILEKIDNLFADLEVPVDFISFLEATAKNRNLNIEISPLSSGKFGKDPWQSLTFQISTVGSFPNFLKFLEKLENGPYLIEIQNLNIGKSTKGTPAADEVKGVFSIKVFAK